MSLEMDGKVFPADTHLVSAYIARVMHLNESQTEKKFQIINIRFFSLFRQHVFRCPLFIGKIARI